MKIVFFSRFYAVYQPHSPSPRDETDGGAQHVPRYRHATEICRGKKANVEKAGAPKEKSRGHKYVSERKTADFYCSRAKEKCND